MVKTFSKNELQIAKTLCKGTIFNFNGEQLTVQKVAKPQVPSGECKIDTVKRENLKYLINKKMLNLLRIK